ncbi:hypothetical protein XENTR_v10016345 [Xenopus tropicalis]|nr:hypothetical protein XENTR_v10016345 [Xenopus tropicalis]KAE8597081.1 hypothetical protein XENTR_v10016345 [Xenopus tropicalis]
MHIFLILLLQAFARQFFQIICGHVLGTKMMSFCRAARENTGKTMLPTKKPNKMT